MAGAARSWLRQRMRFGTDKERRQPHDPWASGVVGSEVRLKSAGDIRIIGGTAFLNRGSGVRIPPGLPAFPSWVQIDTLNSGLGGVALERPTVVKL